MRDFHKEYERWLTYQHLHAELLEELKGIKDQTKEIEERFYKDLEFGTGGLRGIISAGTNRMNIYTIRKVTYGLAQYIKRQGEEAMARGVVIAYDSRKYSKRFAEEAAKVLVKQDIFVYLFTELCPTPMLSFAVRYLKAFSGIVITASHNPPEYNGYKVYNQHGGQITEEMADDIYFEIQHIDNILEIPVFELEQALKDNKAAMIGEEIDQKYKNQVESLLLNRDMVEQFGGELSIVYTPLHGTGNKPVRSILSHAGFKNVHIVKEQELPDEKFSTVKAPNPEEIKVFDLAIELANEINADIIMATDPDADRLGVLNKHANQYQALNGNQLGALLLYYLLNMKSEKAILPVNGLLIKTIVTSDLGAKIAEKYGVLVENTLTGFKYIAEKIQEYQETGKNVFVFGYEESYGYLAGDFVRDKDAVQIAVLVAEMALYYKQGQKNLFDVLEEIYQEFGYYHEDLVSITLKGIEGSKKIEEIVSFFRQKPPKEIGSVNVKYYEDYLLSQRVDLLTDKQEELNLPKSNVLKFFLEDQSWVAMRPSGTEPKIKFYFSTVSHSNEKSIEQIKRLKEDILRIVQDN